MAFAADNTRRPGEEHIPRYTPGFIVLRILQLIVGLVVLGLSAYSVAVVPFSGNCLTLFTVSDCPSPSPPSGWGATWMPK